MEIVIRHNRVYIEKVSMKENFADLTADLIVDRRGRVKVKTASILFYTTLDRLPLEVLKDLSKHLERETSNRILAQIQKKVELARKVLV